MSRTSRKASIAFGCAVATVIWLLPSPSPAARPRLFGPNLFIAGDGFTLEQAVADAAAQHTDQDLPGYKLLVVGSELPRVTRARATPDTSRLLDQVRRSSGVVYACARDVKAMGLGPADLLSGVRIVRGFDPDGPRRVEGWEQKLPLAPDRKMRAICTDE